MTQSYFITIRQLLKTRPKIIYGPDLRKKIHGCYGLVKISKDSDAYRHCNTALQTQTPKTTTKTILQKNCFHRDSVLMSNPCDTKHGNKNQCKEEEEEQCTVTPCCKPFRLLKEHPMKKKKSNNHCDTNQKQPSRK